MDRRTFLSGVAIGVLATPLAAQVPPPGKTGKLAATMPQGDFDKRKFGPGVIRYFDFDSAAQLGGGYRANVGTFSGTSTAPQLDSSVKASGTSSLLFTAPSQSAQGGAGLWFGNFSTDLRTRFGENSEFFVQWRQRFNKEFVETIFVGKDGRPQGGIKQLDSRAGGYA